MLRVRVGAIWLDPTSEGRKDAPRKSTSKNDNVKSSDEAKNICKNGVAEILEIFLDVMLYI